MRFLYVLIIRLIIRLIILLLPLTARAQELTVFVQRGFKVA
jgi:hypothetical protein